MQLAHIHRLLRSAYATSIVYLNQFHSLIRVHTFAFASTYFTYSSHSRCFKEAYSHLKAFCCVTHLAVYIQTECLNSDVDVVQYSSALWRDDWAEVKLCAAFETKSEGSSLTITALLLFRLSMS